MKKLGHLILIMFILMSCNQSSPEKIKALLKKANSIEQAEKQAEKLLKLMTPEEKFRLVRGNGLALYPIERLGIPEVRYIDASAGVRKSCGERYEQTTAFPCPQLLAATWDTDIAYKFAKSIGEELRGNGTHILLGPGMNIYRNSLCGRNFEYVGEDPFLAGQIIGSYVKGLQSMGTAATLKHFICNDAEFKRCGSNSVVSERALHEIYLPPFKAGIDAGAWVIMSSYNLVNGEWPSQNKHLITDILRNELGFQWSVMTDWVAAWNGVKMAEAGVDFEMPGGNAISIDSTDLIGSRLIDQMAKNVLKTCIYAGFYEEDYTDSTLMDNWGGREAVAYQTNAKGITLLKNNGILPIKENGKILVAGNNTTRLELAGGGSAHVAGYNNKTYLEVMKEQFGEKNIKHVENPTKWQIKSADMVILFCGYPENGENREKEGIDRPFTMPDNELIRMAVENNPNTIVCIQTGGSTEMSWENDAAAIIQAYYGGQTGALALVDVLTGKINPSGKLPYSFEKKFKDSPAYGFSDVTPEKLKIVPEYNHIPKGKANDFFVNEDTTEFKTYDVFYDEGVFVGYRWYEEKGIEVRFPFGHGLSYTTFEYSNLNLGKKGDDVVVTFDVKNIGELAGDEVAQVYVTDKECSVERPLKELKGFKRISLGVGEIQPVELILKPEAFKFWDETSNDWKLEPGEFNIKVGSSSLDIRLNESIEI